MTTQVITDGMCISYDPREETLAVSKGESPVMAAHEEWIRERIKEKGPLEFNARIGGFDVTIRIRE